MSDFYVILTDAGQALMAAATAGGDPVVLSKFGVDDGNGAAFTPDPAQTALINEVYQGDISSLQSTGNTLKAQLVIPKDSGGYTVRGFGLYTEDGTLFSICNFPPQEKPLPSSGYAVKMDTDYYLQVTDTSLVELQVNGDDYLTREEADTIYLQIANNLSEIKAGGAAAQQVARDNLALGTAATATLTTSTTDNTMGHVLKVGDRGLGVTVADTAIGFDFTNYVFAAGETLFVQMTSAINYPPELSVFASNYVYLNVTGIRNNGNNVSFIVADYSSNRAYFCWRWSEGGENLTWFVVKLPTVAADVGAMPLYPTPLAVDLNTLGASSSAGVYCQQADINATPELNYPVQQSGTLLVTPSAYGCQQEYTTFATGQKFVRGLMNAWDGSGPWGAWVPQYSPTNPPPATDLSGYVTSAAAYSTFLQGVRMANYGSYGSGGIYDSAHKVLTGIYATNGWDNPSTQEARTPQFNINGSWYDMAYV